MMELEAVLDAGYFRPQDVIGVIPGHVADYPESGSAILLSNGQAVPVDAPPVAVAEAINLLTF